MKTPFRLGLSCATICLVMAVTSLAGEAQNMIGRQAHNIGLHAVPAPATGITIDGNLDDWDLSGQIWSFADIDVRDRFSTRTAAMWDAEYLYVSVVWRDPTPMYSTVNPFTDPNEGWKSDSVQMRVLTDKPSWFTTWHYTPESRSVMHIHYWSSETRHQGGTSRLFIGEPNAVDLGEEIQMAYRKADDGQGFVQEMRIPWTILYHEAPPAIEAGRSLRIGFEYLWGDPTGGTWPVHRYADNLQPDATSREFFWTARGAWGNVTLEAEGDRVPRRYILADALLGGPIPLAVEVPASATRFTLVIEDAAGKRVRNLAADLSPLDYSVAVEGDLRTLEVPWDGLDDHGRFVAEGSYRVRGLTHEGLGADFEMTFYNPGTPPWDTVDGSGAWGADHGAPRHVAAAGDWMIVAWTFAEGGSGIIGIDPEGRKRWGEKRGARALAADDEHLYAIAQGWHTSGTLIRMAVKDGSYRPFVLAGQERPFELPLADAIALETLNRPDTRTAYEQAQAATRGEALEVGDVSAMASDGQTLALALANGHLALLDAGSAQLRRLFTTPAIKDLAFGGDGALYALLDDANVVRFDTTTGEQTRLPIEGLGKPTAMAFDQDGNLVIVDMGEANQARAFSPDGRAMYTVGRAGGRPIRGAFDPQAMMRVSSVAVDAKGHVWTTEYWHYPRRVSVWHRETGELVRDYIGNTGYAATGTFMHDQNPNLAYVGPVEMEVDRDTRTWRVSRILWVPGEGEHFPVTDSHTQPHRFRSQASGQMREYMFDPPYRTHHPWVLFMEMDSGDWQPVFAMGLVGSLTGKIDSPAQGFANTLAEDAGDFSDLDAHDGFLWNDLDNDGRVQRNELEIVRNEQRPADALRGNGPLPTRCGWGPRMNPLNLDFYSIGRQGLVHISPSGFRDNGAPMYEHRGFKPLGHGALGGQQDLVPAPQANMLLDFATLHSSGGVESARAIDLATGDIRWTYPNPYPGVHASHRATMPAPGLLIGPLKITGVAQVNDEIGEVFGVRGNLAQEFFFTADGLYIGAMFRDTRLPSEPRPAVESQLVGYPMETLSQGGEPFSGWMGAQDDGNIRMTTSMMRQAGTILRLRGFESIRRFESPPVAMDADRLIAAERFAASRAAAASQERVYGIARRAAAPVVDGQLADWEGVEALAIVSPASGYTGKAWMAYDDEHLYLAYEINDPNPWRNRGRDVRRLFKTGDAVDVHLGTNPAADSERRNPVAGDLRLLIAPFENQPVAVLMRPIDADAAREHAHVYQSPVGSRRFDRVERRDEIRTAVVVAGNVYRVEAAIPLATLGLKPEVGATFGGDVGFVTSNAEGTENTARTYWANPYTNLVNDEPQEAWLYPNAWGKFVWE